ncbi:hypothetical protein TPHA_0I01200 [Tetrapisispora phaffii CBS 4417]|uniref:Mitochondrial peculiar membrane protein 1 n=1 Tax=Tetrapisispora phaffii (strain ATCC 24235 / CBS 4417 / NBRC 1672 / NRRL Y-8282 / UCD 70-5) TaxID=1071381 RepID=G8BXJ8_TETPH|nr:hypothetical protein TPHA_0I01200 [Tetrapisispora phaffii CBS 4417]CCE64626.1 hypothetical protein TPHA_0I01200 [Tetrapisispora phaffii CBS 4417]
MGLYDKNQDINRFNETVIERELNNADDGFPNLGSDFFQEANEIISHPFRWGIVNSQNGQLDKVLSRNYDGLGDFQNIFGLPTRSPTSTWFGELFDPSVYNNQLIRQGVTGLYSFTAPTTEQYSSCMETNGLSVWDSNGWWRCLFPRSTIERNIEKKNLQNSIYGEQKNAILSKEDVLSDVDHKKYGIFFQEYTDLLNWKSQMNRIIKNRQQEQNTIAKKNDELKSANSTDLVLADTPENLMMTDYSSLDDNIDNKSVIGSAKYTTYNSTREGKEKIQLWKTYYDDDTVNIKSQKTIKPADGSKPKTEYSEKTVNRKDDNSSF